MGYSMLASGDIKIKKPARLSPVCSKISKSYFLASFLPGSLPGFFSPLPAFSRTLYIS